VKDERFYRTIADRFIALRGAPFALSPADISLIAEWEGAGIPLETVLEGIEESFSLRPGRGHVPGKIRALSFSRRAVERAFERYRERMVGGDRPSLESAAGRKIKSARAAVEAFLARHASEFGSVRPYFEAALLHLSAGKPDAEALERLDEKIEAALLAGDRTPGSETVRLKKIRKLHRVPYVSLFYY